MRHAQRGADVAEVMRTVVDSLYTSAVCMHMRHDWHYFSMLSISDEPQQRRGQELLPWLSGETKDHDKG